MTNFKTLALVAIEWGWQASRYVLAAGVTTLAVAAVPVLVAAVATIVSGICVGVLSLMMLVSAVVGTADPPFIALFIAVVLPIGFIIAVAGTFTAIVVGAVLFVGIFVLPVSLLTEAALRADGVGSVFLQLVCFALAGGLAGAIVGVMVAIFKSQADVWVSVVAGGSIFLAMILSVGLFGGILTATEAIGRMLDKFACRIRE